MNAAPAASPPAESRKPSRFVAISRLGGARRKSAPAAIPATKSDRWWMGFQTAGTPECASRTGTTKHPPSASHFAQAAPPSHKNNSGKHR